MWSSIFGSGVTSSLHPNSAQQAYGLQNAQSGIMSNSAQAMAQQQANAYNQAMYQRLYGQQATSKWVYNGKTCTLRQFAKMVFPDDEQAQLVFVLKHEGE